MALAIATCGVGYFPVAPGTLGSLVGVVLFLGLHRLTDNLLIPYVLKHQLNYAFLQSIQLSVMLVAILIVTLAGIWAGTKAERLVGRKDRGAVVIDEVSGQMIALLSASFFIGGPWTIVSAFILFRTFDIWKPYPIRQLEGLKSGLGIMLDDVAAGLYAAVANSVLLTTFVMFSSR